VANLQEGYSKIANKLIECVCQADLTITQKEIVWFVMRYTYGFSRKQAQLSLSFIAKGIGRARQKVCESVIALAGMRVLIKTQNGKTMTLEINNHTEEWAVNFRSDSHQAVTDTSHQAVTIASHRTVTSDSHQAVTEEIQTIERKISNTKYIRASRFGVVFRSLWNLYPKAKRDEAGKRFVTAAAAREVEENESKVRAALDAYLRSVSDPKYIQKASDFFGGNWKQYEPDEPERVTEATGKGGKFQ